MAILKTDAAITEYICTWCGKRVKRTRGEGRPDPGYCPRNTLPRNSGCCDPAL